MAAYPKVDAPPERIYLFTQFQKMTGMPTPFLSNTWRTSPHEGRFANLLSAPRKHVEYIRADVVQKMIDAAHEGGP